MNRILSKHDLDGVLITSPHNLRYFTGFSGGEGAAVITADSRELFVDGRYTFQAKTQAPGFNVTEYHGNIFEYVSRLGLSKIGFEEQYITYYDFARLAKACSAKLVPVSSLVEPLRAVKTDEEIRYTKIAEEIGDKAFDHILQYIKPGVTEREIAAEIDYFMKRNGADDTSFDTIAAFGERSALPHAFPTNAKLKEGEFVLMDYGCKYNGYCSDMTRTVCCGKASDEQRKIYELVLKAQLSALEMLKSGIRGKDAYKAARDIFAEKEVSENFKHSLGHGTGLLIHEQPNLSPSSETVLEKNMTVTVEPGLYFEGEFGVRIEDLTVIADDGVLNLTQSEKRLIEL